MLIDTRNSAFAQAVPLPLASIDWLDGFWKDRFNDCAQITIPHVLSIFDDRDSFFHQVENFRIAAGLSEGQFRGTPYGDGDFYKLMEGMVYDYAKSRNEKLDLKLDEFISLIALAQLDDGYISTKQIIGEKVSNGVKRHGDINDFEEYNFGHLFTSACAHKRITGKDNFLEVAIRCAAYLERTYEDILANSKAWTAVCPSHYMGLVELYRTTGEKKYLDMAITAIDLRDMVKNGTDDNQDRLPLREHRTIVGHGVRSTYLYAGVADLYLETGDETLLPVLESCWENLCTKKLYITGGCGALYTGTSPFGLFTKAQYVHQAFGYEYQLPNVTAYNETCATLGSIFWALRMFAIKPDAQYFDFIERATFNLALAAVSLDGSKYFYENTLRRARKLDYPLMWPLERTDTFHCFCCPTNLSRSLMQVIEYCYMQTDDTVWTGLYGSSKARFQLKNGADFTLCQETDYPWQGAIRFTVTQAASDKGFTLKLRIPAWMEKGYISWNGRQRDLGAADAGQYAEVYIEHPKDASVELFLDMPARYTVAHPLVEEDANQVCVERGPLVYCLESPDASVNTLDDLFLLSNAGFAEVPIELSGKHMIALETEGACLHKTQYRPDALYQPLKVGGLQKVPLRLIPYFAWDNRGFGEMRIWMPIHYQLELPSA